MTKGRDIDGQRLDKITDFNQKAKRPPGSPAATIPEEKSNQFLIQSFYKPLTTMIFSSSPHEVNFPVQKYTCRVRPDPEPDHP